MNIALVFVVVLAVLFGLAYVTKRRFGVLGLALAAGAMLSSLWADTLTPILENAGIEFDMPPLITLVAVGLTLLPAVMLLFSGPSYSKKSERLIGAVFFAALASALLVEPLGSALVLEGQGREVYDFLLEYRVFIVTAGLVLAIIDLLTTRTPKHHAEKH